MFTYINECREIIHTLETNDVESAINTLYLVIEKNKTICKSQGNNLSVSENYELVGVSNTNGTQRENGCTQPFSSYESEQRSRTQEQIKKYDQILEESKNYNNQSNKNDVAVFLKKSIDTIIDNLILTLYKK